VAGEPQNSVATGSGHLGHFFAGHLGLTRFIKYPGQPGLCIGSLALLMASGSDRLNVLEGDDVTISPQDG